MGLAGWIARAAEAQRGGWPSPLHLPAFNPAGVPNNLGVFARPGMDTTSLYAEPHGFMLNAPYGWDEMLPQGFINVGGDLFQHSRYPQESFHVGSDKIDSFNFNPAQVEMLRIGGPGIAQRPYAADYERLNFGKNTGVGPEYAWNSAYYHPVVIPPGL